MTILDAFLMATIKFTDKSNLKEKGSILAHSLRFSHHGRRLTEARTGSSWPHASTVMKEKAMDACASPLSPLMQSRIPAKQSVPATADGSLDLN